MKKILFLGILLSCMIFPVCATSTTPNVPSQVESIFPQETDDFGAALGYILKSAVSQIKPEFAESAKLCVGIIALTLLLALLRGFEGKSRAVVDLAGVVAVCVILLGSTYSVIGIGTQTVERISEYGKLLLPVMTAALAAQGGVNSATAIYGATALFGTFLSNVISKLLVPMLYVYLVLAMVNALAQEDILKKLKDLCRTLISRFFRIVLYIFTGYITITGVIGGTADQAAVKATKLTISGMIPVVGSILSDASETVLVSAGVVKNATGVYGLLAVIALTVVPFLGIGMHYLLLKLTSAISGVFCPKSVAQLLEDFSACMALILAMVGSVCLIGLISTVCFMKEMA